MADYDSEVMVSIEVMAPKEEIKHRQYTGRYGAGTALLLRLASNYRGLRFGSDCRRLFGFCFGQVCVCAQKTFGYVLPRPNKDYSSYVPQKVFASQTVERGGHVVLTTKVQGVELRVVTWNDGKNDKKTGDVIRKNFVTSCGVTLPGVGHRKRRRTVDADGHAHLFFKKIPRPQLVEDYFEGKSTKQSSFGHLITKQTRFLF